MAASTLQLTLFFSWSPASICQRWEIEFVGTVCGTHQYVNDYFQVVYALPLICIGDDGFERIRPAPMLLVPVE